MDKKINVKITANTSKFKKAISDATKSLDKFKKSGEKVGKTNIGKNLNKQFKNVSKESKKTDKQLKKNIKTLKNLNKSKLNKLNKQFSNMDKTVKNNRKTLQSLQKTLNNLKRKSIEAINKALTSMSKGASAVSKGFTNVKNVMNNLSNKAIEAIGKSLANIKEKCTPVANGFKTIKDKISSISGKAIDTVKSSLDKIKDKCSPVANGFTNIKNKINDIKAGAFSTLSSKLDGIKTKASDAGNKFRDLKSRISDAARQSLQKLTDSTTKLNTEGTKSGNVFTNLGNKIKSLTSGALGSLGSKMGLVISSAGKMGSSFSLAGIAAAGAMTKLGASIGVTCLKFAKNASAMLGSINSMSKLTKEAEKLKKTNADLSKKQDDFLNKVNKLNESFSRGTISEEKYKQELSKLSKEQDKLNKESNKFLSTLDKFGQKVANQTTKMGGLAQKNDKLANKLKDLVNRYNELASANGKATLSFDQLINKSTKAGSVFKSLGNIMKSIGGALISVPKRFFNSFKKGLSNFKDGMKGVKESLGNIFNNLSTGNFSGVFGSLKELGASLFKAMPNWVKTVIALGVALKKLYDLGKKRFFEGLSNIKNTLQPVMNTVNTFVRSLRTAIETVTGARFDLASNIAGVIEFDYAIQRAGATCKASQEQIVQLSDKARELGASTKFSSAEVADAFYYMALAGWDTTSMLDAIDDVLQLSNVSGMDLAKTCDIVTDYLSTFGRSSKDAADFCNYMAATSTSTNTTVEQLAEAYNQCAGAASEFGVTQSFLNTQLGILANSGKKSGPAGVVLKNMYTNLLSPPSDDAFAAYKKWGVYVGEKLNPALTRTNELTGEQQLNGEALTKQLKKQYKAYTDVSDKAKMLKMIYGKLALSGGAILLGAKDFDYERLELVQKTSDSFGAYLNKQNKIINGEGKLVNANGKVINSMEDIDDVTRKSIDTFKEQYQVYEDFKDAQIADVLGTTNTDIATTITMLGEAGITGAKRVEQFINVVEAIKNPTKKVESAVKNAGLSMDKFSKSLKYNKDGSLDLAGTMDNLLPILSEVDKSTRDLMLKNMGLGNSIDEVDELIKNGKGSWSQRKKDIESVQTATEKMVEYFNGTLKDKLKGTMSALAEMFISAIYPCKEQITEVIDSFTHFFAAIGNIIKNNGKSTTQDLINISKDWGKWLEQGITNAISGLKNFVTGGGLDTVLTIGTNIITGICDGIINNKEDLTIAISEAIRKICNWIMQNGDQIKQAGLTILDSIGEAIRQNQSAIDEACNVIYDAINAWAVKNSENIGLIGGIVADDFIWGFLKGFTLEKFSGINGFFQGLFNGGSNPISQWGISSGEDYTKNVNTGIEKGKEQTTSAVSDPFKDAAPEVKATASEIGNSFSDELVSKLKSLDINSLKSLQDELKNLQTTVSNVAKGISTCFTDIRSSVRDNLVGCTNITRTQFVNIKNIISNQMSAARNIVTSKMISINKVVNTQSSAARNNATRNFISLRKVIQTQMSEAYRSVSSYMSKIKSATNQNIHTKINVTKTVETVKKDSNASSLSFANFAKLSSMATNKSLSYASLSTSGIGGDIGSNNGNSSSKPTIIHNYIDLDGKIVAKQTAKYMDGELTILNNKNNRKRGTR